MTEPIFIAQSKERIFLLPKREGRTMNKYQKILTVVALCAFCAISAEAKIGDTQDQVIRFAQKQEDIAAIRTRWYGGDPAIDVVYTDSTTLTHVFGAGGREIAQYLYAPKHLTDAQVKEIQRIYHTSWRGMGTTGGVYSWESASNLYMAAFRRETYDYLLIWDRNNIGEINTIAANALKMVQPAPAPQNAAPVAQQSRPTSEDSEPDCLIVATKMYWELKPTGIWERIGRFNENTMAPGGHAVLFYQPTPGSRVVMYDKIFGSLELPTQSHDLNEILAALNQLFGGNYNFQYPRWIDG
jgi:hypothetical protein